MTSAERYERASNLVNDALDLPPEARSAYLDFACQGDEELRREIESLLAEEGSLGDASFDTPLVEQLDLGPEFPLSLDSDSLPERLGPFRILRLLGEGGMATVVLAEQAEPYKRRLALKLINGLGTQQLRKRFVAECQALARLNHPNVASLYEAGTIEDSPAGALPYVAMEWVDGLPITTWSDRNRLSIEERLELLSTACAGIQHAHEKGVLHCDLKPNNVLVAEVDGRPQAKIIDFGIARALDGRLLKDTRLTVHGLAGSPNYLSPEAAALGATADLDTRSDVHALGLILFELLVGARPFETNDSSIWSFLERLRSEEPPPPSRRLGALGPMSTAQVCEQRRLSAGELEKRLRGDLDAIVGKAIDRDPKRRYGTPAELAADLDRHLRSKPIEARPPSTTYVLGRFLRRRRKTATAAALLTLALVGGFVARSVEAKRANRAAVQAQEEAARAREALAETQELTDFLSELFDVADPENRAASAEAARILLDHGVTTLQSKLADRPLQRARLLLTISRIYSNLRVLEKAEAASLESLALREENLDADAPEIAAALSQLGVVLRLQGRKEEAEPVLQRALGILEGAGPEDRPLLGQVNSHLGNLLWSMRRYEEAEEAHRRALSVRRELDDRAALAESLNNLGVTLRFQKRWAEAREILYEAAEIFADELGEDHPRTSAAHFNLGRVEEAVGNWETATGMFQHNLERTLAAYEPTHQRCEQAFRELVLNLEHRREFGEAARYAERWIAALEEAGADAETLDEPWKRWVNLLVRSGRQDAARRAADEIRSRAVAELGDQHPTTLELVAYSTWQTRTEDEPAAVAALLRRTIFQHEAQDASLRARGWMHHALGEIAARGGRTLEAMASYREALSIHEEFRSESSLPLATTRFELGKLYAENGRWQEAEPLLRAAYATRGDRLPTDHPDVLAVRALLAPDAPQSSATGS